MLLCGGIKEYVLLAMWWSFMQVIALEVLELFEEAFYNIHRKDWNIESFTDFKAWNGTLKLCIRLLVFNSPSFLAGIRPFDQKKETSNI